MMMLLSRRVNKGIRLIRSNFKQSLTQFLSRMNQFYIVKILIHNKWFLNGKQVFFGSSFCWLNWRGSSSCSVLNHSLQMSAFPTFYILNYLIYILQSCPLVPFPSLKLIKLKMSDYVSYQLCSTVLLLSVPNTFDVQLSPSKLYQSIGSSTFLCSSTVDNLPFCSLNVFRLSSRFTSMQYFTQQIWCQKLFPQYNFNIRDQYVSPLEKSSHPFLLCIFFSRPPLVIHHLIHHPISFQIILLLYESINIKNTWILSLGHS